MSETPLNIDRPINGQIKIADEVIGIIAATAAHEVEGVAAPGRTQKKEHGYPGGISPKNSQKTVTIGMNRESVDVKVAIKVKSGYSISDVSLEVQKKVKTAVETMTALFVSSVDVNVTGVLSD